MLQRSNRDALLQAVTDLALAAGREILAVYQSDFSVQRKDDDSPLTEADLAAHRCIVAGLARLTPALPVISEEGPLAPFAVRSAWPSYWLVDPLDGTREFVKRNGEFTVNIALIEHGLPVLGVVHAPALRLSYLAARGIGAFQLCDGVRIVLKSWRHPVRPNYFLSRSHREPRLDIFLAKAPAHDANGIGSSLKFCRIAEGAGDLYPRLGPTSEWDTAAAQCVLECAGGAVLRLPDLRPLAYNGKDSILNPDFIAVGDPSYDWAGVFA